MDDVLISIVGSPNAVQKGAMDAFDQSTASSNMRVDEDLIGAADSIPFIPLMDATRSEAVDSQA